LRTLVEAPPLIEALNRYPELYQQAMTKRWLWRLGVEQRGLEEDTALIGACEKVMATRGLGPDAFFFTHRGGRGPFGASEEEQALKASLAPYVATDSSHPYWSDAAPQSMLIDEVEAIWAPIAGQDDWSGLFAKVDAVRRMGEAMGARPEPVGHSAA
jgi:uncharacterized protein YdiU (UPF0061 family)